MDLSNNKRIDWIDICKVIAIFFVVWGHSGIPIMMDKYIHVFHMPIFFFLSGLVFRFDKIQTFTSFVLKKIKTILIPYFVFGIGIFYFWLLLLNLLDVPYTETQTELLKGLFTINSEISPFGTIQWFLTCLFIVEIFFYGIVKFTKNHKGSILAILFINSFIGYFILSIFNERLIWSIDIAFTAIVFYGLGYLVQNFKNTKVESFITSPNIIKILLLLIISVATSLINDYVNMRILAYGNYFLYYLSSITSIVFCVLIGVSISKIKNLTKSRTYKWLLFIGRNTIIVLVLNNLFIIIIQRSTDYLLINNQFINFTVAVIVTALMIPASLFINKFLPWSLGRKTKTNQIKGTLKENAA